LLVAERSYSLLVSRDQAPGGGISVFLSHSTSGDGQLCGFLADELRRFRIDPWYSHGDQGIDPGQDWEARLRAEIERCDMMVVLASRHLHDSHFCKREVQYASSRGKHILVLRVDDHPIPGWVSFMCGDRQHISLTRMSLQDAARNLSQLCQDALEGHLNPGEDVVERVDLQLEVAARGTVHPVRVQRGAASRFVDVRIPPSGRDQSVRLELGGASTLTLYVRVLPSDIFHVMADGRDVLVTVQVPADRIEECEVLTVPTLDGMRPIVIPPEARQPGGRVRLKGHGIGPRAGKSSGDLVVQLSVVGAASSAAAIDEWVELERRLGRIAPVLAVIAPILVCLGAVGAGTGFLFLGILGYIAVTAWIGSMALAQRRTAFADWLPPLAAALSFVPGIGPWGLAWCGFEIDFADRRAAVRRALLSHAVPASIAGFAWLMLPGRGAPELLWRGVVFAASAAAGVGLWRTWRAVAAPRGGR
jgi:hypothetical protein